MLNLSQPYGDLGLDTKATLPKAAPTEPAMQAQSGGSSPYAALFAAKEKQYKLPSGLLRALAGQESSGDPSIQGVKMGKGSAHEGTRAMGLFQFMPATWKGEGHTGDPFNAEDSTEAAAKKLSASFDKRNELGEALADWYGRGKAPAGHPTTAQFAEQVMSKMNSYGGERKVAPLPEQQSQDPQGFDPRNFGTTVHGYDRPGDTIRGLKHAAQAFPMLGYGAVAGAGATAESMLGEGGISTAIKEWGVEGYKEYEAQHQLTTKESDSITYSWEEAKKGNYGALIDWSQYALGYVSLNIAALASGAATGAAIGRVALGSTIKKNMKGLIRKEMQKLGKAKFKGALQQQAVKNVAARIGRYGFVGASGYGLEMGEIGGGLASESMEKGAVLTGKEVMTGIGWGLAAGSAEFAGLFLGIKGLGGKLGIGEKVKTMPGAKGKLARGASTAAVVGPAEFGTEFFQTYAEEAGMGHEWNDDTFRSAIDAGALGAVSGPVVGTVGGVLSKPVPIPEEAGVGISTPPSAPGTSGIEQVETQPGVADAYNEQTWIERQRATGQESPIVGAPTEVTLAQEATNAANTVFPSTKKLTTTRKARKFRKLYEAAAKGDAQALYEAQEYLQSQTSTKRVIEAEQVLSKLNARYEESQSTTTPKQKQAFTQVETSVPKVGESGNLPGMPPGGLQPGTVVANSDTTPITDRLSAQRRSYDAAQEEKAALAAGDIVGARKIREQAQAQTGGALGDALTDEVGIAQDNVRNERNAALDKSDANIARMTQQLDEAKTPIRKTILRERIKKAEKAWAAREVKFLAEYDKLSSHMGPHTPPVLAPVNPKQRKLNLRKPSKLKRSVRKDSGEGSTKAEVEADIAELQVAGNVKINVVGTFTELPPSMQEELDGKDGSTGGVYNQRDGTVWLIADKIGSKDEAMFIALHEAAHRGLLHIFGNSLVPILRQMYKTNVNLKKNADSYIEAFPDMTIAEATEESLADMARDNTATSLKGWDALLKFIREWVQRITSDITFTDDQIRLIVAQATRKGIQENMDGPTHPRSSKLKRSVASITVDDVKSVLSKKAGTVKEGKTWLQDKVLTDFSTLGQMVDVIKSVLPSAETFDRTIRRMQAASNEIVNLASPIATQWGNLSSAQDAILTNIMTESENHGLRPDKAFTDKSNEWGRTEKQPNQVQAKAEYNKLKQAWDTMSPDAQKVYTDQMRLSQQVLQRVVNGMKKNIRDSIPDEDTRNKLLQEINEKWRFALNGRPYVPHKRYGKYIVIVKDSKGNREVWGYETETEANAESLRHLERFENNPTVEVKRGDTTFANLDGADQSFINNMKQKITAGMDAAQAEKVQNAIQELYVAALPEMSGAKRLLRRKNVPGWSTNYRRAWSEAVTSMARYAAKLDHMDDLRNSIEDASREAGRTKSIYAVTSWDKKNPMAPMVTEFFNTAAAKTKHIHSDRLKNPNIEYRAYNSTKTDVMEQIENHYIARLGETAGPLAFKDVAIKSNNNPNTVVKQSDATSLQKTRFLNILRDRYSRLLEHKPRSRLSELLVNMGFMNYLGWTPAFAFMNATQVSMLTLPRLSSDYGFKDATSAITDAYAFTAANHGIFSDLIKGAVSGLPSAIGFSEGISALKVDDFKNQDGTELSDEHRTLLQYLLDHGKLDFTQGSELNEITSDTPKAWAAIIKSSSLLAHPTEVINRVVTAMATYNLAVARANKNNKGEPLTERQIKTIRAEVVEVLDTTQYDYSRENRPLILQNHTARVMLQFRQFSQQTAWQIGRIIYKAFMDSGLSKAQRTKQKIYLLHLLASTFTLAGIRGMPAAGLVFVIASTIFGDDGDDFEVDMQKWFKENLGDVMGPMMTDGVFAVVGLDASRNIGLGDIFPGTNTSNRASVGGKDRVKNMLFDAAGPTMAMIGNWYQGWDTWQRGDMYRGIEEALPKAFRTPMTAYRQHYHGMTTKNGVVRIGADDLTVMDTFITFVGLKTQKISQMQGKVRLIQGQEDVIKFRSKIIRKKVQLARKAGDIDAEMDGLLELEAFNKKYPFAKITQKSLRNKLQRSVDRRLERTGGVATTKLQETLFEQWLDDADEEDLP